MATQDMEPQLRLPDVCPPRTVAQSLLEGYSAGVGYSDAARRACRVNLEMTMEDICERFHLGRVIRLRAFLKKASAIISGSNALLPFHRGTFTPGDLDVYAPISKCSIVSVYLKQKGYLRTYGPEWYAIENPSIRVIRRYKRANASIDVIYSRSHSAIQVVAEFHSTLVMNYIGHFGVVCFYPGPTLSKVGIMNSTDQRAAICRQKYEERGFQFVEKVGGVGTHICKVNYVCPSTVRTVHDGASLFVPFEGVEGQLPNHEKILCWRLNNNTCGGRGRGFTVGHNGYSELAHNLPVTRS